MTPAPLKYCTGLSWTPGGTLLIHPRTGCNSRLKKPTAVISEILERAKRERRKNNQQMFFSTRYALPLPQWGCFARSLHIQHQIVQQFLRRSPPQKYPGGPPVDRDRRNAHTRPTPSDSPNLASSDFHLFLALKKNLV
ncbi:hypothetical protein TNCV_2634971 [Trichonephila clavipes]|nr:hypothetical protein TNCV_2634971 [Trichonephila clavipes]